MNRNSNRIAQRRFSDRSDVRTRDVGAAPKKGVGRVARIVNKAARRVENAWQTKASEES